VLGRTGPAGPTSNLTGPVGPVGLVSTVTGPAGPPSNLTGPLGPTGPQSSVTGPTGPRSNTTGPAGPVAAQTNLTGTTGPRGPMSSVIGSTGPTGMIGTFAVSLGSGLTPVQGQMPLGNGNNSFGLTQSGNGIYFLGARSGPQTTPPYGYGTQIGNYAANDDATSGGISLYAIGDHAALVGSNSNYPVVIGPYAGANTVNLAGVHIGAYSCYGAVQSGSSFNAISIGAYSAYYGQYSSSNSTIAIGTWAGATGPSYQPQNQIVISASGTGCGGPNQGLYINQFRQIVTGGTVPSGFRRLAYNSTTREVVYYS